MNVIRNAFEPWKTAFNSWPAMTFLTAGFTDKLLLNKILLVICFQCSKLRKLILLLTNPEAVSKNLISLYVCLFQLLDKSTTVLQYVAEPYMNAGSVYTLNAFARNGCLKLAIGLPILRKKDYAKARERIDSSLYLPFTCVPVRCCSHWSKDDRRIFLLVSYY